MVIRGPSGSGKSSLLHVLTGFVRPTGGTVLIDDQPLDAGKIAELRKNMAYLPQEILFGDMDVREFLLLPFGFALNKSRQPGEQQIREEFKHLDLNDGLLDKSMQQISGGEKQRVALTSCLLLRRRLLLLDEPTSALDKAVKHKMMDYLFSLDEVTIISASHDDDWVKRCNKSVELNHHNHE